MRCIWALLVLVICVHTASTKKATATTTEGANIKIVVKQPAAEDKEPEDEYESSGEKKSEDGEEEEYDYSEEESGKDDAEAGDDYDENYDYADLENSDPAATDLKALLLDDDETMKDAAKKKDPLIEDETLEDGDKETEDGGDEDKIASRSALQSRWRRRRRGWRRRRVTLCNGSGRRRLRCDAGLRLLVSDYSKLTARQQIYRRQLLLRLINLRRRREGLTIKDEKLLVNLFEKQVWRLGTSQRKRLHWFLNSFRKTWAQGGSDLSGVNIGIDGDDTSLYSGLVLGLGGRISDADRRLITADISGLTLAQRRRRQIVLLVLLRQRRQLLGLNENVISELNLESLLLTSDYSVLTYEQKRRLLFLLAILRRVSFGFGRGAASTVGVGGGVIGSTGLIHSGVHGTTGLNNGVVHTTGLANTGVVHTTGLANTGVVRTTGLNNGVVGTTGLANTDVVGTTGLANTGVVRTNELVNGGVVGTTGLTNTGVVGTTGGLLSNAETAATSDDVLFTLDVSNLTLEQRRRRGIILLYLLRQRRQRLGLSASDANEVELERLLFAPNISTLTYAQRAKLTRLLGELRTIRRTSVGTTGEISNTRVVRVLQ